MKKILLILFLIAFSGCYISQPSGYIDYRERRLYDWDPMYYVPGYIDPFFYRREPPVIIYRDRYVPSRTPRVQEPRRNNFSPSNPSNRQQNKTAPIRKFSDKKSD